VKTASANHPNAGQRTVGVPAAPEVERAPAARCHRRQADGGQIRAARQDLSHVEQHYQGGTKRQHPHISARLRPVHQAPERDLGRRFGQTASGFRPLLGNVRGKKF
jgi:hypothetical protein